MAVLLLPVVLAVSASQPVAVLEPPLVLFMREKYPLPVLLEPVSLKTSELVPTAVFCAPLVLSKSAATPTAVLELPLLSASAPPPTPVLKLPVVVKKSDRQPSAVFPAPIVRELSASHPSAVVKFGKHPSGAGLIARAPGKNARQANTGIIAANIVFGSFIFSVSLVVSVVRKLSLKEQLVYLQPPWPRAYAFRSGRSLFGFG